MMTLDPLERWENYTNSQLLELKMATTQEVFHLMKQDSTGQVSKVHGATVQSHIWLLLPPAEWESCPGATSH